MTGVVDMAVSERRRPRRGVDRFVETNVDVDVDADGVMGAPRGKDDELCASANGRATLAYSRRNRCVIVPFRPS